MSEGVDLAADRNVMPDDCALELKRTDKNVSHNLLNPDSVAGIGSIMRFSSPARLFRIMTHIIRFEECWSKH